MKNKNCRTLLFYYFFCIISERRKKKQYRRTTIQKNKCLLAVHIGTAVNGGIGAELGSLLQMGSQMRPMDNFFTRTNMSILIGLSMNNIPIDVSSLKWGDKSPSFAWGSILCLKKRQKIAKTIYVFPCYERTQQRQMIQKLVPLIPII